MEFSLIYRSKIIIRAYKDWISSSSRVLDIGCGNAVVTEELKKYFRCFIVGTDLLDYRKRDIPFKAIIDKDKLPFKEKEFDISMFNDLLHHCKDWKGMLSEALRVAGRVLIFEMEPAIIAKISDWLINKIHNPNTNIAINLKTLEQWKIYFEKLNLDYECRKIEKPLSFYPFINFAFNLKR